MKELHTHRLIDSFGRQHDYLRISVTDKCNLRCNYCMPKENIRWKKNDELLTNDEIIRLAKLFVSLGIKKIRLTGGEPFTREDIDDLLFSLSLLKKSSNLESLAITTNGTLLEPKLGLLKKIELDSLNISLDTLKSDRFKVITRRDLFDRVWKAVNKAIEMSFPILKLNVVVMNGFNDDEILDFSRLAYDAPINIRFIEFMPFKDNDWQENKVISYRQIKQMVETKYKLRAKKVHPSSVAKDFYIENGRGTVSFITSMTDSFCGTCNRLRITADGYIKSCLFFPAERSLRTLMRNGANDCELTDVIRQALLLKPPAHLPATEIITELNRTMIQIGG